MNSFSRLLELIQTNSQNKVLPNQTNLLKTFSISPEDLRVVIIGQDPYPNSSLATGLAFGIPEDAIIPKSLSIMMRELINDYPEITLEEFDITLESWLNQGVMLLNSSLTCFEGKPNSHREIWEDFMTGVVKTINDLKISLPYFQSLVFVLIGKEAQKLRPYINENWHYVLCRSHPAAEAYGGEKFRGFYREVNEILTKTEQKAIKWA